MFNFSLPALFAGFVFGVFGFSFIKHGKREGNSGRIMVGVLLCMFPYFVESAVWTWVIGSALMFGAYKWT